MKTVKILTAALIASGTVLGASQAMAYGTLGDFYVRADATRTEAASNGKTDRGFAGALGWKFTDNFGVEFNAPTSKTDYKSTSNGIKANAKYMQYSLLGQYYPLGGEPSQVQPYVGLGASYTKFTDRGMGAPNGKLESDSWDPTAQLGLDYYLTSWLAANVNVQYTHMKVKGDSGFDSKYNPIRVGAGLTFRF
ncbi:OmpW/AlkL family protein [Carnimonas nigrificans]|uniref:OmpW/AlkL family protein n=1 Tax=Carnimonas nigrificans TaxID=64323 RepID=UPI000471B3AA|nr:OmpW family outer membrane protein [Carnimonas nigrificans]